MQSTFAAFVFALITLSASGLQALAFEDQKLLASDASANSWFGAAVAASGRSAVIGAAAEGGMGAVYAFYSFGYGEEAIWLPTEKVESSDATTNDCFGTSVAISEDANVMPVGAPGQDDFFADCGSAYVFRRGAALSWVQEQQLFANPDCGSNHNVGKVVALSGDVAVIGSRYAAGTFVVRYSGSSWSREQLLPPQALSIAASGDLIALAGHPSVNRVYRHTGTVWQEDFAFDAIPTAWVALSGNMLAIGSSGDDDVALNAGAVHLYRHDGSAWQLEQKIFADDGTARRIRTPHRARWQSAARAGRWRPRRPPIRLSVRPRRRPVAAGCQARRLRWGVSGQLRNWRQCARAQRQRRADRRLRREREGDSGRRRLRLSDPGAARRGGRPLGVDEPRGARVSITPAVQA